MENAKQIASLPRLYTKLIAEVTTILTIFYSIQYYSILRNLFKS